MLKPLLLTTCCAIALATSARAENLPAFPGAEGFGALATGGRDGTVYHVTNLDDSGPGSLRDAVSQGPRIVVFDVSGAIELKSILKVASDITLAGQSAPGDGICTYHYEVSFSDSKNVIVRYMRFRQGLTEKQDRKNAVAATNSRDIIFDHCTMNWGRWDTFNCSNADRLTLQNCIIGEGCDPQRFGGIVQSDHMTFARCLWTNNQSRNPKIKGTIQYINNIVYNWGVCGLAGGHSAADHYCDVVGNLFIKGPSSNDKFTGEYTATDKIFARDNLADLDRDGTLNPRPAVDADFADKNGAPTMTALPYLSPTIAVTILPADKVFEAVLPTVGASLHRDAIDRRLVEEVQSLGRKGQITKDPATLKDDRSLQAKSAPADSDHDGMPDDWEAAHHLNVQDASDAMKKDASGYANIEVYLNSLCR